MRVVLATLGTLGDLYPFLALGEALRLRGHSVAVACAPALHTYVLGADLEALPCRPNFGPEQVRQAHADFDHWPRSRVEARSVASRSNLLAMIRQRLSDLLAACQGCDLLLHNSGITGESVATEILGIPSLRVIIAPERLWNPHQRAFLNELETAGMDSPLEQARDHFFCHQTCRRAAGLPETPAQGWAGYFAPSTLIAASPHFLEPLDIRSWDATVCGFWFYESPQWRDWKPEPELAVFVDRRPIVLSLSSQPLADPARVVELHVKAAQHLGRPLLVQSGWAGLCGSDNQEVMFRGFLPQDWLFARAACVIHHGGIGTMARALRNRCPMLVEPWGNDQFFNAWMAVKAGWASAVNPKRALPAELARLIERNVLSSETRQRLDLTARRIAGENGIENAIRAIQTHRPGMFP